MPGWASHVVGWLQQFAEEEGLMLGVSLAGYAIELWMRLFQASRALDRVRRAPALGLASVPEHLKSRAETGNSGRAGSGGAPAFAGGGGEEWGESSGESSSGSFRGSGDGGALHEEVAEFLRGRGEAGASTGDSGKCELATSREGIAPSPPPPRDTSADEATGWRGTRSGEDSLVVVRGRVQAASDAAPWAALGGPVLVRAEISSARGVVYERVDKVVCSNVHQLLHNVSEHQVDLRRSEVPFELSEIPVPPSPSPVASSSGVHFQNHLPHLQVPSFPSPSSLPFLSSSPPRLRVSLEGLTQPLPLVTVHSAFHRSPPSIMSLVMHLVTGSQAIGQRVEERVLPTGTDLTAVGLVRQDKDGRPKIVPAPDLPVFLTPLTRDQLVVHLSSTAVALLHSSVFVSVAAAATLGYVAFRRWDHRRRQERSRRLVEDMAELERAQSRRAREAAAGGEGPAGAGTGGDGQERPVAAPAPQQGHGEQRGRGAFGAASSSRGAASEDDAEEDVSGIGNGELCVVCLSRRRRAAFVPCGHLVCCWGCARNVRERSMRLRENCLCPLCRTPCTEVVRIFNA